MKTLILLFVTCMVLSCQNNEAPKEGPNTTNVENVEGTIPDSTNSITIDKPTDTVKRDSLKK